MPPYQMHKHCSLRGDQSLKWQRTLKRSDSGNFSNSRLILHWFHTSITRYVGKGSSRTLITEWSRAACSETTQRCLINHKGRISFLKFSHFKLSKYSNPKPWTNTMQYMENYKILLSAYHFTGEVEALDSGWGCLPTRHAFYQYGFTRNDLITQEYRTKWCLLCFISLIHSYRLSATAIPPDALE